jgi:glucose-6-phosphate dehydrogenase assembly protein OpcA
MAEKVENAAVPPAESGLSLEELERELVTDLRAQAPGSRAMTLNLICCAADEGDAARLAEALAGLAKRHPGRVLLLVPADSPTLDEWRARTVRVPLGDEVFQALQLEAGGAAFASASNAVAPLLLGELPVFVWWRLDNPIDNPRFEDLATIADRILLDSQELAFHPAEFAQLGELQARLRHGCCVGDLVWAHLTRWRQLIVQGVETLEAAGEYTQIEQVRLKACCGQPALNGAALLLAGWLGSRLHWTPTRALDARTVEVQTNRGRKLAIHFEESADGTPDGILNRAEIVMHPGTTALAIGRKGECMELSLHREGAVFGHLLAEDAMPDEMDALRQELDIVASDHQFQDALDAALRMLKTLGVQ